MPDKFFYCQKCNSPLKLDKTLLRLNPAQLNLLVSKNNDKANITNDLKPSDFIPKDRLDIYNGINHTNLKPIKIEDLIEKEEHPEISTSVNSNSYVMLSDGDNQSIKSNEIVQHSQKESNDTTEGNPNTISSRIHKLAKIFEILSTNQDIDHPLCVDCSNLLIENFKLKFDQNQKEKENYLIFLKKLKDKDNPTNLLEDELDSKLLQSIEEYKILSDSEEENLNELKNLEMTKNDLESQLKELKSELNRLNENELSNILKLKNKLQLDLNMQLNRLEQSKSSYQIHLNHLDNLRNLNIYNSFFQISFDKEDKFGTINGFRLGYKVPLSEINAALGQIILLLVFLIKRLKLKSKDYKLVPMGSQSQIIKFSVSSHESENGQRKVKTKTILNLYSSNEFSLGKLFNFNKLDVSMIALLDILSQIESKLTEIDQEIELPYKISSKKDTIGGKSIRISSNSEWTESCKFLLTNLNWILSYASVHTSPDTI